MYACMYVCIYTRIHANILVHLLIRIYLCTDMHVYACLHAAFDSYLLCNSIRVYLDEGEGKTRRK